MLNNDFKKEFCQLFFKIVHKTIELIKYILLFRNFKVYTKIKRITTDYIENADFLISAICNQSFYGNIYSKSSVFLL